MQTRKVIVKYMVSKKQKDLKTISLEINLFRMNVK